MNKESRYRIVFYVLLLILCSCAVIFMVSDIHKWSRLIGVCEAGMSAEDCAGVIGSIIAPLGFSFSIVVAVVIQVLYGVVFAVISFVLFLAFRIIGLNKNRVICSFEYNAYRKISLAFLGVSLLVCLIIVRFISFTTIFALISNLIWFLFSFILVVEPTRMAAYNKGKQMSSRNEMSRNNTWL